MELLEGCFELFSSLVGLIIAAIVLIVVVIGCCALGWFFALGPGAEEARALALWLA